MLLLLSSGVWRGWKWSHRGMALQGFGKGGAILLVIQKGTGLNPAGPALAKPHGHWGPSARGGWGWFYPRWGSAQPQQVTEREIPGEVKTGKSRSQGSPLWWTANLVFTGWTPQFAGQWSSFNELKVSAAEVALLANRHGRPVPPTALPKHKGHSPSDAPAWGKQCKEKGVLFKMKIN